MLGEDADAISADARSTQNQATSDFIARISHDSIGVELIDSPDQVQEMIGVIASATREVCSMLPGGPYPLEYLRGSWAQDIAMLTRGVRGLCLYQADAVRLPNVLKYLADFVGQGAQVRVSPRVAHRTVIVDRRVAMVGVEQDSLARPYLVVRQPALVRSFHAQFAAQWAISHSVGFGPEDSLAAETVEEILNVLQSGVTDEVAARKLGISIRTVRRRVAAVMDLLGATSRFEAGVKAAKAGWV